MTGNMSVDFAESNRLSDHSRISYSTLGQTDFIQLQGDGLVNDDFTVEVLLMHQ